MIKTLNGAVRGDANERETFVQTSRTKCALRGENRSDWRKLQGTPSDGVARKVFSGKMTF